MESYAYEPTKHFLQRLERIKSQDREGHRRIMQVVDRLLRNPADSDGTMHGPHSGKFKKYVGKKEFRILYYYCDLCRKANRRLMEECRDCRHLESHSVVFFDVFHKNEKEKLHY